MQILFLLICISYEVSSAAKIIFAVSYICYKAALSDSFRRVQTFSHLFMPYSPHSPHNKRRCSLLVHIPNTLIQCFFYLYAVCGKIPVASTCSIKKLESFGFNVRSLISCVTVRKVAHIVHPALTLLSCS